MKKYIDVLLLSLNAIIYGLVSPVVIAVLLSCFYPQQGTGGANQPFPLDIFLIVLVFFLLFTGAYGAINVYLIRQYPQKKREIVVACVLLTVATVILFVAIRS